MFGLTFEKLLIIGVIAVFLLGPERLPHYAAQFARLVRSLRDMARGAKDRMRDEMGPEFDEVDWRKLDPRQYDPRRIVREALLEEPEPSATRARPSASVAAPSAAATVPVTPIGGNAAGWSERLRSIEAGEKTPPPFDLEST